MRTMWLVLVASLAGACFVEAPNGEVESESWSEAAWRPSCQEDYEKCENGSRLADEYDDWGYSRCYRCAQRCDQEGNWPNYTYGGKDCRYWRYPIRAVDAEGAW
jgi:hypothetical protein